MLYWMWLYMDNKILLGLYIFLIFASVSITTASYIFEQDSLVDIKVACADELENICEETTECKITILDPSGNTLINYQNMTHNEGFYNYTLSNSSVVGQYISYVFCSLDGSGFESFNFDITPTGKENTMATGIMSSGLLIFLILMAFLFAWFGFKFSEADNLFVFAPYFLVVSLIICMASLFYSYILSRDILHMLGMSELVMTLWFVLSISLIGIALVIMMFITINVFKAFKDVADGKKEKGADGWDG